MTLKERIAEKYVREDGLLDIGKYDLDDLTDFITTLLAEQKERIVEKAKELYRETVVLENGVNVETYGYPETYNEGINDIITLIKKTE